MLVLGRIQNLTALWTALLIAFVIILVTGLEQHFGGLEATRQFVQSQPDWQKLPRAFLKKLASNRIYGTLFYPNALAGALLLFTPVLLTFALNVPTRAELRWALAGTIAAGALACLYWSGSKAGWLIALVVGLIAWMHSSMTKRVKWLVMLGVLLAGVGGFAVKYAGYFEKGAPSLGARFDYWQAAVRIVAMRPIVGSGPGTFSVLYRQLKSPEAEMARLAHNDYLEQASDSGLPGLVLYGALILASLVLLRPRPAESREWTRFAVWLGLLGWSLQSLVEFGLYVPALAWPVFVFLGWLWAAGEGAQTALPAGAES